MPPKMSFMEKANMKRATLMKAKELLKGSASEAGGDSSAIRVDPIREIHPLKSQGKRPQVDRPRTSDET